MKAKKKKGDFECSRTEPSLLCRNVTSLRDVITEANDEWGDDFPSFRFTAALSAACVSCCSQNEGN